MSQTLEAKDVHKTFEQAKKELHVLKGISIAFEQGKTYAITGASGSGKSTLLHILGGLDAPTQGEVKALDRNSLGFVFQFHYLINELTVIENIMLMGLIRSTPKKESRNKALGLLKYVGLDTKADAYPFELSGGEQQRVSILRAIFNRPAFLLADEPTGNLDALNAEHIVNFLEACKNEWNMGIILCSHDKAVYGRMETVLELKDGMLSETQPHPVRPE